MFQVERTPGGESVVTVLLNAVGSAGGTCPIQEWEHVNTHLEEEKMEEKCPWTKKGHQIITFHAPITAEAPSFECWEIHSLRSFPIFMLC